MNTLTIRQDPFSSIKIPEYRNLMIGRFLFIMGLRMMSTVVGWWMYELTNSPLAIGLIGLAEVIPAVSMALYAGHVIDLSEKRKLLLKGLLLYLGCALFLFLLSTPFTAQHLNKYWISICIYIIIACTGIIRAFAGPTFSVMVSYIVPKSMLQNATSWNQGTWLTASVVGHALGGFLIAFFNNTPKGALACTSLLMVIAFCVLFQLKPKPALNEKGAKKTWDSVKEGLRFVFTTKEVLGALSLDLFAVLFGGAVAMVPVYARDILHVGPQGFGWLNASADMGSMCSVALLTLIPLKRKQGKIMMLAVAGFGVCIIVFALSRIFWISFLALLVSGILDGISVVVRGTILQLKTPDNMRGRVMSVNSMFINSGNELGQFESGIAAKVMGVISSVIFGGCITGLVVLITWFKAPSLRKMEY